MSWLRKIIHRRHRHRSADSPPDQPSSSVSSSQAPSGEVSSETVSEARRQHDENFEPEPEHVMPPNGVQNEPQSDMPQSQANGQVTHGQQTGAPHTDGSRTNESRTDGSQTDGSESESNESHTDESQTDALPNDVSDRWTAAYNQAVSEVDNDIRAALVGRSLEQLFENLNDFNEKHKTQSIFRRGMERIQKPLQFLDIALSTTEPLASFDPAASTAFGLVRSVTTVSNKQNTYTHIYPQAPEGTKT